MISPRLTLLQLALCASTLASVADARPTDSNNPHVWKPRTKSVAVFKNGYGFFTREGSVDLRDGWCVAREIPPAAFGTLAIYAHDPNQVVDLVGSGTGEIVEFDDFDAPDNDEARRRHLESSLHLRLELTYLQNGKSLTSTGKLLSVGPRYAVLEGPQGNAAVPVARLTRIKILDLPLRAHVNEGENKSPSNATLGMAYLRSGITWIPEYTLRILDDSTAELTLRGTLINEAEDLIHADVHFVVGVPAFLHTDYLAPIAVGQALRTIGTATAPSAVMSQVMNRAAVSFDNGNFSPQFDPGAVSGGSASSGDVFGGLPPLQSTAATDYTMYTKTDLTVRRGERAIVTLMTRKIQYSHFYRWDVPQPIKHFLRLQNDTDTAWTTGPCLAISDAQPLSEDLLRYTPKGGATEFPVTAAINISHSTNEFEKDRELKAHSPEHNRYFDRVALRGELKLRNFEKRTVEIVITAPVRGKPMAASDDGRLRADTNELRLRERRGDVQWRIKIEPEATKTLTYDYERYVPSN